MAVWKVFADHIKIFPHPNADKMDLAKVGPYQLVVGRASGYKDGDEVYFAPEHSVLPPDLAAEYVNSETGISYLHGPEHNRVARVRLRGEYSDGITIPQWWAGDRLQGKPVPAYGEDISALLGITKYEPPIPAGMDGQVEALRIQGPWAHHDVEHFRMYSDEFVPGELVYVTEKIHGSQVVIYRQADNTAYVTTKGLSRRNLTFVPSNNLYWQALKHAEILECLAESPALDGRDVQLFGEVIPCQKGYTYGQASPTLLVYRMLVNGVEWGQSIIRDAVPNIFHRWVPILWSGQYTPDVVDEWAGGSEQVSGKALHIREGAVISPWEPRNSKEGFPLYLKVINPKYKDTGETIS